MPKPKPTTRKSAKNIAFEVEDSNGDTMDTSIPDIESHQYPSTLEALGSDMKKVKDLIAIIVNLTKLGVSRTTHDKIPKIAVVGDQSAGKSSLVEAICGIKLPRDSGTCTRCVTQVYLTSGDGSQPSWMAKVSLKCPYVIASSRDRARSGSNFHPWIPTGSEVPILFLQVDDPSRLEDAVRRAQTAILNPSRPHDAYTRGAYNKTSIEIGFSPNIVQVDVTAPQAQDLTLYDLPGVISQTEDGKDQYLPKIVQNLVKEYVSQENTLILLTCSMESDLQNSRAASIVRFEAEGEGRSAVDRTMGVLTKPDRLPIGQSTHFLMGVLTDQHYPLGHSYFVTKQPDQYELDSNMTHQEARVAENLFFTSREPWRSTFAAFKDRFGTENLVQQLSLKLAAMTFQSLPKFRIDIRDQIVCIEEQLGNLPESPTENADSVVLNIIHKLAAAISNYAEGNFPMNQMKWEWKQSIQTFRAEIAGLRPLMRHSNEEDAQLAHFKSMIRNKNSKAAQNRSGSPAVSIDDSEEELATPKKRKMNDSSAVSTPTKLNSRSIPMRTKHKQEFEAQSMPSAKTFALDEIRRIQTQFSTSSIPNSVDPKADYILIKEVVAAWEPPTMKFLRATERCLQKYLDEAMDQHLGQWEKMPLSTEVRKIVNRFLNLQLKKQVEGVAPRALRLEKNYPVAEPSAIWKHVYDKEVEELRIKRLRMHADIKFEQQEAETGRHMSQDKRKAQTPENLVKFLGEDASDPFQCEVESMAKICAYYDIASMRFVSNIEQAIEGELFEEMKNNLENELVRRLGLTDANLKEKCVLLLAENEKRVALRMNLLKELKALEDATKMLDDLDRKYAEQA